MVRYIPNKETNEPEEIEGEQQLAVKVYNRKKLTNNKTVVGLKLVSYFDLMQEEIGVWERAANCNVIKIFSLYNYEGIPDMYLLMEFAKYGQIMDTIEDQGQTEERLPIATYNQQVLEIATLKGRINWPEKESISDLEIAAKWIFY